MPARRDEFDEPWQPVVWVVFAFGIVGWAWAIWMLRDKIPAFRKPEPAPIFYSANQKPVELLDKDGKVIACKVEGLDKNGFERWAQVQCPVKAEPIKTEAKPKAKEKRPLTKK
jgi:hypothetical protein